ncbi:MAG: histidine kinase N-terminal domain-containing protein [Actinomycetota bacterium]|nr:histidine kinase N-terminal domain-containing protein [Actinomycetota bacterium]
MSDAAHTDTSTPGGTAEHIAGVAANLQLIADMGYGDVALAIHVSPDSLRVVADARPMTAIAAVASTRVGKTLRREDEPEAYAAYGRGEIVTGERRRITRGISFGTIAYPIGSGDRPRAVLVRDIAQQVLEAPGTMETQFMRAAEDVIAVLGDGPLLDARTDMPYSTFRRAGDGVMRISPDGSIIYASPNAVNIMRLAGVEGALAGTSATLLPGSAEAIVPVLRVRAALNTEVAVHERVLGYRTLGLGSSVLVLMEDVTEARLREQEIKVKEATIREVHHRVKNNLQTIASLLRIQGRRAESEEARRALAEATERVASMAVVHEMLAGSTAERIDFTEAAKTVVDMVRQGLAGDSPDVSVTVKGTTGDVPAQIATSLALVVAELVHNAIEHGITGLADGAVTVDMRRLSGELVLTVRDNGSGLPDGFDLSSSANLGLAIVRTIVEDDLRGTLSFGRGPGTTVTVRVPLVPTPAEETA